MDFLFAPQPQPSLLIVGMDERFPVRRIFCIGRNYMDHAREMGAQVDRGHPCFFTKPADAVVTDGRDVPWPQATSLLHHEVEMVVALNHGGHDIDAEEAMACVFGYGVGLDLTRRDLQAEAKERRWPWDTAKALDHGAPISALCPASQAHVDGDTVLTLTVNGDVRQQSPLSAMIWSVAEIIALLSGLFELKPGDLVFTGTPAGVGPLLEGDRFQAALGDVAELDGKIGAAL